MALPANWTQLNNNAPNNTDLDTCVECLKTVTPRHGLSNAELRTRLAKKDEITGLNNYMMETYLFNNGGNNSLAVFLERSLNRAPNNNDGSKGDPQRNHWCCSIGIDKNWDLSAYPPEKMYAQFKALLKYILGINETNFGSDSSATKRQLFIVYPENASLSKSLADLMFLYMWYDPKVKCMEKVENAYARYTNDPRVQAAGGKICRLQIQQIL